MFVGKMFGSSCECDKNSVLIAASVVSSSDAILLSISAEEP
jgi:hypothetical protein